MNKQCSKCKKCSYDGTMKKLCLDLDARALLLDLIEEGIQLQIDNIEFLHGTTIDRDVKYMISKGIRTHFDCLLPKTDVDHERKDC